MAATTLFFYDFVLTLPDEVSHITGVSLRQVYRSSCERLNTLGTGGNHGVRKGGLFVEKHSLTT